MHKPFSEMTKAELNQYYTDNKDDEEKFQQLLDFLIKRLSFEEATELFYKVCEENKDLFLS